MAEIHTLLFYKFIDIEDPQAFADDHLKFCKNLNLLGRILVSTEGINGSVCGTKDQVEKYKKELREKENFSDIRFKEEIGESIPFTKIKVLVKDTILNMGEKVDISNGADYISPEELIGMYSSDEEVIILDTRNDYEWKVGKFKGAKTLPIKTFREFPQTVMSELKDAKEKKIITYCTGGIRCEKATAFMKEQGFKSVYQLKDGILKFVQERPNTFWEGKCFVFDKRMISNVGQESNDLAFCEICNGNCDLYRNCRNVFCDKFFVMCVSCEKDMNGCCSPNCLKAFRKQCMQKALKNQGRRSVSLKQNGSN